MCYILYGYTSCKVSASVKCKCCIFQNEIYIITMYNIITHESHNYVWDESDGQLVASVFTTCIIKHLRSFISQSPEIHHIIIYSDGCFYQNRNTILSNALLAFCVETNISIEQKYLVSGHTQMECDATHSLIERKVGKRQINLPSQFVQHIREARKQSNWILLTFWISKVSLKYIPPYVQVTTIYINKN